MRGYSIFFGKHRFFAGEHFVCWQSFAGNHWPRIRNQYYLPFFLGGNVVKLVVRDRETIQEAVRRFRKLVERSGIKKEMRRREYYEKPSETKRRARLRAERRARRNRLIAAGGV
tara:strand:+ start:202 stop:543 length:342 start_codon:yes stop_codon:yes gene_type:complete